jgi:hypothetical protein
MAPGGAPERVVLRAGGSPDAPEIQAGNPCIAPDERFLIFVSSAEGGFGEGDLYVSFREGGAFGPARNLGAAVNTAFNDFAPGIGAGGERLFFTSERPGVVAAGVVPGRPPGDIYEIDLAPLLAAARTATAAADRACAEAPGWRHERIALPPEFAPTLPAGVEELYFAPGMFEPASDSYFTYVFSLAFAAPQRVDADGVRALLDTYYRGLIGAVAKARSLEGIEPSSIRARVERSGDGFGATVDIVDAFVTARPVTLHMGLRVQPRCVVAAVSPQPPGAPIWRDLERALACVPCPAP